MTIQYLAIIALIAAGVHFWISKRKNQQLAALIANQVQSDVALRKTLAMGLYYRFHKTKENETDCSSSLFIRQDPLEFEHFVADVMGKLYGGSVYVSQASGDYGIDIEHEREDGMYYGQVKCYKDDLDFSPIAKIHSNMEKHNAVGGFVVTTSDFSERAKKYAQGLNIQLINGEDFVDLWMESLELETNKIKKLLPAE